jgi:hypothetical protein
VNKIISAPENHPFVGVWVTGGEDSDVTFEISANGDSFHVVGVCISDGEVFEIENLASGENWLSFDAKMPSTGWRSKNVFRLRDDGKADLELTIYEVWKKK